MIPEVVRCRLISPVAPSHLVPPSGINSRAGPGFPECQPLRFQLAAGPGPAPHHYPPSHPGRLLNSKDGADSGEPGEEWKYFAGRLSSGRKTAALTGWDRSTTGARRGRAGDGGTHGGPLAEFADGGPPEPGPASPVPSSSAGAASGPSGCASWLQMPVPAPDMLTAFIHHLNVVSRL